MIRPARFMDAPAIERLIRSQHERSKYATRTSISDKALSATVMAMLGQQGQPGPHGTYVAVAVEEGKVVGFIAGVLGRIYGVGRHLVAVDEFIVNEGRASHSLAMIDGFIEWAKANPKVIEISMSWSDALPGAERMAAVYQRKGFARTGEVFEMRLDAMATVEGEVVNV